MSPVKVIAMLLLSISILCLYPGCSQQKSNETWEPLVDWGHWRLGHRTDIEFLEKNQMTLTFGSGAPNFESVSDRKEFDQNLAEATAFNDQYHARGYIVLRYLSTSLNGATATNKDQPQKEQIHMLKFYQDKWTEFEDLIGPKPAEDPTTWIMVHPDGSFPHYRYAPYGRETGGGFEAWGCPDNPYYVSMMEGKIRAQAATGIDGSYVDWTHIAGGTCYCDYTRQNFIQYLKDHLPPDIAKAKYGLSDYEKIKLPEKRGEKFWMEWITFRCWTVAEFHKKLRTAARQVNPHFMISGNIYGGFGYGPIAYDAAGHMEMLGRDGYDDFIYSEIQEFLDTAPRKNEEGTKISNSPALKFLTAASHGKPVIIYATEITPPIFPDPSEKCLSAMAQINIAEAAANQSIFREKRETPPGATAMYRFLAANEKYLLGARLTGNIAILASLQQYLADELSFAFSTSRVLADRGINHVMIVEDDLLSDKLGQYEVIVIPYLPLLSTEKQMALQKYVEAGGRLLILGPSGVKNEYNLPHPEIPLAKLLGQKYYPATYTEKDLGMGKMAFIPVRIPASKFLIAAKAKSEYTTFGPTMADVFPDIPEGYTRNRINPELRNILENAADRILQLLPGKVSRLNGSYPYLEMTMMEQKQNKVLLVHLVNYDVTVYGDRTPARDVALQIYLPAGSQVKSMMYDGTLTQLMPLTYHMQENLASVILPEVDAYGLLVIEL